MSLCRACFIECMSFDVEQLCEHCHVGFAEWLYASRYSLYLLGADDTSLLVFDFRKSVTNVRFDQWFELGRPKTPPRDQKPYYSFGPASRLRTP